MYKLKSFMEDVSTFKFRSIAYIPREKSRVRAEAFRKALTVAKHYSTFSNKQMQQWFDYDKDRFNTLKEDAKKFKEAVDYMLTTYKIKSSSAIQWVNLSKKVDEICKSILSIKATQKKKKERKSLSPADVARMIAEWGDKTTAEWAEEFNVSIQTILNMSQAIRREDRSLCPPKPRRPRTRADVVKAGIKLYEMRRRGNNVLTHAK
jgi:hypothetical protein